LEWINKQHKQETKPFDGLVFFFNFKPKKKPTHMQQHGLTGSIRVPKSESMVMGNKTYVAPHHIERIFNGRGRKAVTSFDKDDYITHPTKGRLLCYPGKVIRMDR
jgi:hypothetical protein